MEAYKRGKRLGGYVPDYVVFDLETTGLNPAWDQIIELSAVSVKGGEIKDTFSTLVNPGRTIRPGASAVNGITDEMVAEAPCLAEAMEGFLSFSGKQVLVGHNIHTFDMKFLYRAAEQTLHRQLPNDYIDTLPLSRRILPDLPHHRLTDLAAYFGFSTEGAHRALADCLMNQRCFEALARCQDQTPSLRCPVCGGKLVLRKGRYGAFYGCSNFPECRYTRNQ